MVDKMLWCSGQVRLYSACIKFHQEHASSSNLLSSMKNSLFEYEAVLPEGETNQINHLHFNPAGSHCVYE